MNFVLYESRELRVDGTIEISGDRAKHLLEVLRVAPGDTVRTLLEGVGRGTAEVRAVNLNALNPNMGKDGFGNYDAAEYCTESVGDVAFGGQSPSSRASSSPVSFAQALSAQASPKRTAPARASAAQPSSTVILAPLTVEPGTRAPLAGEARADEPQRSSPQTVLIIAAPRPQSMKKILEVAGTLGVARIAFINGDRVEKSYFSSSVFSDDSIAHHLRLGMEQGGNPFRPQIDCLPWFRPRALGEGRPPRVRDGLERLRRSCSTSLLLHPPEAPCDCRAGLECLFARVRTAGAPVAAPSGAGAEAPPTAGLCAVIGPEGGWTAEEVAAWRACGCVHYSLGSAIARVETAVTILLGQLMLLQTLGEALETPVAGDLAEANSLQAACS